MSLFMGLPSKSEHPMRPLRTLVLTVLLASATAGAAVAVEIGTYVQTLPTQALGYVAREGSLDWYHTFQPLQDRVIRSIVSVTLSVNLRDDTTCPMAWECLSDRLWGTEYAQLSVEGVDWMMGSADAIYDGDVSSIADLLATDGILGVSAASLRGDFDVVSSTLTVQYEYDLMGAQDPNPNLNPGGQATGPRPVTATLTANPTPEPSAALLFSTGALLFSALFRSRARRA